MLRTLRMKDPVSTWTHFVPFLAAIAGLVALILLSAGNASKVVTMTVFGASAILLYGASSLYHWVRTTPRRELILRKLDHMAIYLLIAGSYTPVFFYGLTGAWRWAMLLTVWGLAAVGMVLKVWLIHVKRFISTAFYAALGWIALVPFVQLVRNLPTGAIALMLAGGLSYTAGAVIYATKWLNFVPNKFGFHEVFHLFIVAGTVMHFVMMVLYIVPL